MSGEDVMEYRENMKILKELEKELNTDIENIERVLEKLIKEVEELKKKV